MRPFPTSTVAMLVMLLVGACDSYKGKLTKANYDRIVEGQTRADVEQILGPGHLVEPKAGEPTGFWGDVGDGYGFIKMTMVDWEDGKRGIRVMFFNDKVQKDKQHGGANKEQHDL